MASVPIPKLTRTTNLVSDNRPAPIDVQCPNVLSDLATFLVTTLPARVNVEGGHDWRLWVDPAFI